MNISWNELISALHFLRPDYLWLLLGLLPLAVWVFVGARGAGAWQQWVDPALQPLVLTQGSQRGASYKSIWLALIWLLATLALAGPTWEQRPTPLLRSEQARLLVLDLSRSMLAADIRPSRLELARLKVRDLLTQSRDGKAGLVAFAAQAFPIAPLTDDIQTLLAQVPTLHPDLMPAQGGRIDRALVHALAMLKQGGASMQGGQVILVTDSAPQTAAFGAAQKLREAGFELSVLAVGTAQGAPIPEDRRRGQGFVKDRGGNIVIAKLPAAELRQLAEAGGGRFSLIAADDADVERLLTPLETDNPQQLGDEQAKAGDQWIEAGPWLLLLLLPLAAMGFRRGWLMSVVLALSLSPSNEALAAEKSSWWQTPDQQGWEVLQKGNAEAASELFESPAWQAAAKYKAGQYADAAALWQQQTTPQGSYNAGNALAHAGDLPAAIEAWQQVPEDQTLFESAQHNIELAKKLLEQQQQDSDQQQDGEKNEQEDQDSEQQSQSEQQNQDGEQSDEQSESESQQSEQQNQSGEQSADEVEDQPPESEQAGEQEDDAEQEAQPKPQPGDFDEPEEGDAEGLAAEPEMSSEEQAKQQVIEQWLNRVPDDPGGLLREKFKRDYKRRIQQRGDEYQDEEQAW